MPSPTYYIQELLRQPDAPTARAYLGIVPGGALLISAGTLSSTRTDVTFADSNGVSFGLSNNGVLTASVAPAGGGLTNIKVSAGAVSALRSDLTFSNSGGVSFGLNGAGVITATVATNYQSPGAYLTTAALSQDSSKYAGTSTGIAGGSVTLNTAGISISLPAYLTTAMQSNASSAFAGTGFTTATTGGTNIVGTLATNGLSMGVPAYLTAATGGGGAGTGFTTASTAGSDVVGTLSTNGLSMGIPAYLTTAQPPGAYLTTAMASDASSAFAGTGTSATNASITLNTAGLAISVAAPAAAAINISAGTTSSNVSAVTFSNGSGVSFGFDGSNVTASVQTNYLTTFPRLDQILDPAADKVFSMGSNQLQLSWATGGSFSTNATRQGMFELDVAGNLTQEADVVHAHQHGGAPTLLDILHVEGDGANVTGLRLQMSASVAGEINQPLKFTTRDAGFNIGSVPMILGTQMSNSVANLNANYLQGKASSNFAGLGFTSTSTNGSDIVGTLDTGGLRLGVPAYLTTAASGSGGCVLSYYRNADLLTPAASLQANESIMHLAPAIVPQSVSASFVRLLFNQQVADNTAAGTSANTSFSLARQISVAAVFMTEMTGGNAGSLGSYTSCSAGLTCQTVLTAGATGSRWTVSYNLTFPYLGNNSNTCGKSVAASSTNYGFFSNQASEILAGFRVLDIPFAASLSPGNYWLVLGMSLSVVSAAGLTILSTAGFGRPQWLANNQGGQVFSTFGSSGGAGIFVQPGNGNWLPGLNASSTSLLAVSDVSTNVNNAALYFQLMRSA